ncbi:MAG TPA: endospore germination permease [Clostridiales bacterium]|jgi:spore germination protein KB|nr:endospore germination permease [Clostridiales bacterium]HQD31536.1 endospore germination permease [Clostridiales bacterium]
MLSDDKKISIRQAIFLFVTASFTPTIRIVPAYAAQKAKQAAWLSPVVTAVLLILLVQLWQVIYRKYRDKSLMDIYCDIAGPAAGTVILIIYLLWMVLLSALYIRYFAMRLVGAIYPNTDISVFIISMLAVIVYTLGFGVTTLARFNEVLLPFLVIVFCLIFIMMIPNFRTDFLTPVSVRSILPVLNASMAPTGIVAYFSFMFIFGDRINNKENINKIGFKMVLFLLITQVVIIASIISTFSYRIAQRTQLPFLAAVKQISVFNLLEKVESIVVSVWVLSDFIIICFFIICILSMLKSFFRLSDPKPLIGIYVIFSYFLAMLLANNVFEMERMSEDIALPVNIILGFVIPAIMFVVGKIRKKV